jgi:hypothetical protein
VRVVVLLNFLHPELEVLEGLAVSHIIDEHDPMGPLVVGGGDGSETVLPGSVPLG